MGQTKLKVLLVSAECVPFAKVGGLADVVGALPKNLKGLGVDARVLLPLYQTVDRKKFNIKLWKKNIPIIVAGQKTRFDIYRTRFEQIDFYFIHHQKYLSRGQIYTWSGHQPGGFWEKERFLFFTEGVIQAMPYLDFWPQVLHLNDWHTGLVPKFLSLKNLANPNYRQIKTLFTIHNLASQGAWSAPEILPFLDMTIIDFAPNDFLNNDVNSMLFGIRHSDLINTVSPSYAQEILTKKYGEGLEKFLRQRKKSLSGILNGIDNHKYNPARDKNIYKNYSSAGLVNKEINKIKLQAAVGLKPAKDSFLLGLVSRLTHQKGIDWVIELIPRLEKINAQLIVLGTGEKKIEQQLARTAKLARAVCRIVLTYDDSLAQKIYAGADAFLVPSRFEPCGLTQMIAMRYGTVPIVRKTGGLKDTVSDYKCSNRQSEGEGFVFRQENPQALWRAVRRAKRVFETKHRWQRLQKDIMLKDFSWKRSARAYIEIYQKLINT